MQCRKVQSAAPLKQAEHCPYSSEEPTLWEYLTVMDANFDGTLQAGNVGYVLDNIDGIKIKRRKVNEYDWITLDYVLAEELGTTLSFTFYTQPKTNVVFKKRFFKHFVFLKNISKSKIALTLCKK